MIRKIIKLKKAQIEGEQFAFIIVLVIVGLIIVFGFKMYYDFKNAGCKTELQVFSGDLKHDTRVVGLKRGDQQIKTYTVPCGVDKVYLIDAKKEISSSFAQYPLIQDNIECLKKMGFQNNVVGEVINIGPDEEFVTINELARIIAELLDFDLKPVYVTGRPQEVKLAYCSSDKARKLLGYKTQYSLREGLSEMIAYIKHRGPRKFRYHIAVEIVNDKTPVTWRDKMF